MRNQWQVFVGLGLLLAAGIAGAAYWLSQPAGRVSIRDAGEIRDPDAAPQQPTQPSTLPPDGDTTEPEAASSPVTPKQAEPEDTTPTAAFRATVSGVVVDERGMPVAGADVLARVVYPVSAVGDRHQAELGKVATSSRNGSFEATIQLNRNVARLDVALRAEALWHVAGEPVSVPELQQGTHKVNVQLSMIAAGAIFGFVRDADGAPKANVTVTAARRKVEGEEVPATADTGPGRFARALERLGRASTRTGANGEYRFEALRAGEYDLAASHGNSNVRTAPGAAVVEAGRETRVDTDFVVGPPTTLRFRVLDQDGFSLKAGAEGSERMAHVTLFKLDGSSTTARTMIEDEDFVALAVNMEDVVRVAVAAPGYRRCEPVPVSLKPGEENTVPEFRLTRLPEGSDDPIREDGEVTGEEG